MSRKHRNRHKHKQAASPHSVGSQNGTEAMPFSGQEPEESQIQEQVPEASATANPWSNVGATKVVTESSVIESETLHGPNGTQVIEPVPPELPPPTPFTEGIDVPLVTPVASEEALAALLPPVSRAVSGKLRREAMRHQVDDVRNAYVSDDPSHTAQIPSYRKQLAEMYNEAFEEEWYYHCLDILRLEVGMRKERCQKLFSTAYDQERLNICAELLKLDSWMIEQREFDVLARDYAVRGELELVGLLLQKNGVTPAYRKHVNAHVKLGASVTSAVEALTDPLPMRFRSQFKVLDGNVLGVELFAGTTWLGRLKQFFRRKQPE